MRKPRRNNSRDWLSLRLVMVAGAFCLALVILLGRAFELQVLKHEELSARAQRQFLRQVEIAPRRGVIYDRNQEELAVSLHAPSVYASPLKITDPVNTGRKLARALGLKSSKVIRRLKTERGFVWVARRVDPDKAEKVRRLKLNGVGMLSETRRYYPNTTLASHVLGFSGLDAKGLEGLELGYDGVLRGRTYRATLLRDALGRKIHLTPASLGLPQGQHLILTLDKGLQYQAEKVLADTVTKFRAKSGQAVVMVPSTGEILAMASLPAFNPNVFGRYSTDKYRNRAISDSFEPGSTFKIFTAAAALRSHKVSLERLFDCEKGKWKVGNKVIHDHHPNGKLNLADIIKHSSNIGAAKVGREVGRRELYQTYRDFGFGSPSGVDLPGETRGILRPASAWQPLDLANISFGQGVAVTALQLTSAVAAVANGGVLMKPFVVRAVMGTGARLVRETQPQAVRRVMGARETRILSRMLTKVTEPGGTGTQARVASVKVAGKTGTAQKPSPDGGYAKDDYIAGFVGYAPADDPQVVVLVSIDSPRGQYYGGQVAAPAFARITKAALASLGYLGPEQRPLQMVERAPQPTRLVSQPVSQVQDRAVKALAAGRSPDLSGCTLRQVLRLAGDNGVKVRARGWGRVISQSPKPGRRLSGTLTVKLSPPWREAT